MRVIDSRGKGEESGGSEESTTARAQVGQERAKGRELRDKTEGHAELTVRSRRPVFVWFLCHSQQLQKIVVPQLPCIWQSDRAVNTQHYVVIQTVSRGTVYS